MDTADIAMNCDHETPGMVCWKCAMKMVEIAEAAEARAADLLESNRELSEANDTLRAERDAALSVVMDGKRAYQSMQSEIDDLRRESEKFADAFNLECAKVVDLRRQLEHERNAVCPRCALEFVVTP